MARKFRRTPLALAILALLHEAPMHPYRIQRLIKERGKDQVINVEPRASLYQTIQQLLRAGLIAVAETSQAGGFPERTVYQLTAPGRGMAAAWLREMLSSPAGEFPEFPAAVSLLPLLPITDALHQLEKREAELDDQIERLDLEMSDQAGRLPRLFLLESEYLKAVLAAERDWVRSINADLRSGRLAWDQSWMAGTSQETPQDPAKRGGDQPAAE